MTHPPVSIVETHAKQIQAQNSDSKHTQMILPQWLISAPVLLASRGWCNASALLSFLIRLHSTLLTLKPCCVALAGSVAACAPRACMLYALALLFGLVMLVKTSTAAHAAAATTTTGSFRPAPRLRDGRSVDTCAPPAGDAALLTAGSADKRLLPPPRLNAGGAAEGSFAAPATASTAGLDARTAGGSGLAATATAAAIAGGVSDLPARLPRAPMAAGLTDGLFDARMAITSASSTDASCSTVYTSEPSGLTRLGDTEGELDGDGDLERAPGLLITGEGERRDSVEDTLRPLGAGLGLPATAPATLPALAGSAAGDMKRVLPGRLSVSATAAAAAAATTGSAAPGAVMRVLPGLSMDGAAAGAAATAAAAVKSVGIRPLFVGRERSPDGAGMVVGSAGASGPDRSAAARLASEGLA